MPTLRKANERGHFNFGWLDTHHSFSFGEYYDPNWVSFRSLRVLNDDLIKPQSKFPTHPHRDMEIISYIVEGELSHKDNMGNGSTIRPGDIQRMTAGRGVTHSEANNSQTQTTRLIQIWIMPEQRGLEPSYEQKNYPFEEKWNKLRLNASRDGRDGSVTIHQDADMYSCYLEGGNEVTHEIGDGRAGWLQIITGEVRCGDFSLSEGDGLAIESAGNVSIKATKDSELLLFDLK